MTILNQTEIIRGIKTKVPPTNRGYKHFDKKLALHPHNYPLSKITHWEIYGYRKDKISGIKRPYWITKDLPTGRELSPRLVGLDGFYNVKPTYQIQ